MAQPKAQPSFIEQLLKPLYDRLGFNGMAVSEAAHQPTPKKEEYKIDVNQLRAQGWSDKDIEMLLRQARGGQQ